MSHAPLPPLSEEQIEHFMQRGHVVLHDCFSRAFAEEWTTTAFRRLGYDPDDPATWEKEIIHMPSLDRLPMQEIAPKAWEAACQLLGGEERVAPCFWGNGLIVNFHKGADRPWEPPSPQAVGWHKDGDFFRHFLDSPEQGLLTIVIWSDIAPQGGGTFVACDSVGPVARLLAAHPEGVLPGGPPEAPFNSLIHACKEFIELTGQVGDVALIHPFVLHASSQNHSGKARFITNPPIALKEPMRFDREDPTDFSPVERAVLRGLGVERFAFQPTAPRERVISEGVKRRQRMLEEEQARMAAAAKV
ncbi:MAG TPA: hypothetical protein VKU00_08160 [Chthonomonadaceae bacterium]|nr:hypothetical protein [Chthonomonadaceae bacterium]